MRVEGIVLAAGNPSTGGLGLPMGEREDRHEVRARMEAKRARSSSPWAGREAPAPGTPEQKAARNSAAHDPAREKALFESKPLAPSPAPRGSERRTPAERTALLEDIGRLYLVEKLSQREVGIRLGISPTYVNRLMAAHGIPTRPRGSHA
ncbi:hypothetical protein ACFWGN_16265 [Oerskovia sp. NPDC060338]|uniref:hypothetical protein n=1 Tax=Oerskovia sp. NPDC060338 TaxID=3347100 RepID=UPI0036688357